VVAASPPADFSTTSPSGSGAPSVAFRGLWCQLPHGYPGRDATSFSACQQGTRTSVPTTTRPGVLQLQEGCSPSTMAASGSGASAAGGSVTAWASGAGSSTGGTASPAPAVAGSSPSQLRSVDFLRKYPQKSSLGNRRLLQQVLLMRT
jgi:hypothetical protein